MKKEVKKIWGKEILIVNKEYCGKLLILKKNFKCSLHYHKIKDETFLVMRGLVLMELNKKKMILKPNDSVHIPPNALHRFTGLTDSQIIEFSTHHKDSDSYRKELSGKVGLRKAYDYDGVVTKGIRPERNAPIITGRSFEELDKVKREIRENFPVYFNPVTINNKTFSNEVKWKARMINSLKIERYYDDNAEVVYKLRKFCPKCHIICIGDE